MNQKSAQITEGMPQGVRPSVRRSFSDSRYPNHAQTSDKTKMMMSSPPDTSRFYARGRRTNRHRRWT